MISTRRASLTLAATLVTMSFPVLLFATPAAAAAACAPGTSPVSISASAVECIVQGRGSIASIVGSLDESPTKLAQLSSSLGAAAGDGATVDAAAGTAALDGAPAAAGSWALTDAVGAAGAGPAGLVAVTGLYTGYKLGGLLDEHTHISQHIGNALCGWGVDSMCNHTYPAPTYQANPDVSQARSNGFKDGINTIVGNDGNTYTFSTYEQYDGDSVYDVSNCPNGDAGYCNLAILKGSPVVVASNGSGTIPVAFNVLFKGPNYNYQSHDPCENGGASSSGMRVITNSGEYPGLGFVAGIGVAGYYHSCNDSFHNLPADSYRTPWEIDFRGKDGATIVYYLAGNPLRPAASDPNPLRHYRTISTCADGTVTNTDSDGFHETEAEWPAVPSPAPCSGSQLAGVKVYILTANLPDRLLFSQTTPQKILDATDPANPCSTGKCRLGLSKIGPAGTELGDCFDSAGLCAKWFTDPDKTDDYQCTYGLPGQEQNVDLSECNAYAPTFDVQQLAKGHPYGDPRTGEVPKTSPRTTPSSGNDTDTDPTGTPGLNPGGGSCFPSGWSAFNPVEWVLKPVECALVWAFVPDSATLQQFVTSLRSDYDGTTIGEWSAAVAGLGQIVVPGTSCDGLTLHVPDLGVLKTSHDYPVFSTCDEPWHSIALLVKAFLIVAIAWGTALGLYRIFAASFGMVVPTRGS